MLWTYNGHQTHALNESGVSPAAPSALFLIAGVTFGVSRLRPAAPTVDRAAIWSDEVKRGPMLREVRGLGTLVPEEIRWIPAQSDSRVGRLA